jgi:hypothetical protein
MNFCRLPLGASPQAHGCYGGLTTRACTRVSLLAGYIVHCFVHRLLLSQRLTPCHLLTELF